MRTINNIVIHCSAGFGNIDAVKAHWKRMGWKQVGYHFFIDCDGTVHRLADLNTVTNGVLGHNADSVHISYQGGVRRDNVNVAQDTRTPAQKAAIIAVIKEVKAALAKSQPGRKVRILGHRDFSPDTNKNGVIEKWERIKECPSFDAIPEYAGL